MTAASAVTICNMALDHLGKPSITALDESSTESQLCLRQYPIARQMCLQRSPWTFARKIRKLSLETTNELSDVWEYCYDLPNEMLGLFRINDGFRNVRENATPVPSYIEEGKIYTNLPDAWAYYSYDNIETQKWSPAFDDVVALFLAFRMAPQMTRRKGDVDTMQKLYKVALAEAIELDAQQEPSSYAFRDGGYVDARGAGGSYEIGRQADGSTIWGW